MTQAQVHEQALQAEEALQEGLDAAAEDVRARILHLLEVYPYLSRAMIQTGLSPALPPKLWNPVLENMVEQKLVHFIETQTTSPAGRSLTKGIYYLPKYPYPVITTSELERLSTLAN